MSNCLIFALHRWFTRGGFVIMRKSNHGWWPHFMWCQSLGELQITEYIPVKDIVLSDRLHMPPIVFKGYVREGMDRKP